MYTYTIKIVGMGCEIVAGELSRSEIESISDYCSENNISLKDLILSESHLKKTNIGIEKWYELDDICHVYGAYPHMSRVKVIGEDVKVYKTIDLMTFIDDYYSISEFDSIYNIMDNKGVLIESTLSINEPFDPNNLTLLVTKVEIPIKNIYVITGFIYGSEYLKLLSVTNEELDIKVNINKTQIEVGVI